VIDGGAGDELTMAANRAAFAAVRLRPHHLAGPGEPDLRMTVLGQPLEWPVVLAPCNFARVCHPHGEVLAARAAVRTGAAFVLASGARASAADVARASGIAPWVQIYLQGDRGADGERLATARAAGCRVLCVTVDTAVLPFRERDRRNRIDLARPTSARLAVAALARPRWGLRFLRSDRTPAAGLSGSADHDAVSYRAPVTATELEWLRSAWEGPLVVKGILSGAPLPALAELGVDGVVVSNHGGRNLDGTAASLEVLPEVVDAAAGRVEVLLDGGVRRGTDVAKALALGARACLVGRPYMFALAGAGEPGVERLLMLLRNELLRAMALLGAGSATALDTSFIAS
jgi:isopentenyl diphosphate isomerase/L-lactate dehydrogenase-like FMN-dependent dehydrogenase